MAIFKDRVSGMIPTRIRRMTPVRIGTRLLRIFLRETREDCLVISRRQNPIANTTNGLTGVSSVLR